MKLLLTGKYGKNKFAIVDEEDYRKFSKYKWHLVRGYACSTLGKKQSGKKLHRLIMDTPKELQVDHINHNKLDNRKINLRNCTRSENEINKLKTSKTTTSKFIGVTWHIRKKKWMSYIKFNKKTLHLGYFEDENMAAKARDLKAKELYKIVPLNFAKDCQTLKVKENKLF